MAIIGEFGILRLVAFFGIFLLMLALETIWPRRQHARDSLMRLASNLSLAVLNSAFLKLLAGLTIPFAAASAAVYVQGQGWGLLNNLSLPAGLEIIIALILLDLAIYAQHVAAHLIPLIWRFHKVHHSDIEFDVTTAIRFHPVEIFISMVWKITLVFLLGPSPVAVILFEIILNGCAMFNHANLKIPIRFDAILRLFIVTPDMHRIHHSTIRAEQDSNYGFNIPLWDRLFKTYTPQPLEGHQQMKIGLKNHQDKKPENLLWSLQFPFVFKRSIG